jgi:hypothetical protein
MKSALRPPGTTHRPLPRRRHRAAVPALIAVSGGSSRSSYGRSYGGDSSSISLPSPSWRPAHRRRHGLPGATAREVSPQATESIFASRIPASIFARLT